MEADDAFPILPEIFTVSVRLNDQSPSAGLFISLAVFAIAISLPMTSIFANMDVWL